MDGSKGNQSDMDQKKRKSITHVWRPVSTQSDSIDVKVEFDNSHNLGDGEKSEVASQVEEVRYSIFNHVSNTQHSHGEAQVVNEPVDSKNFSPTVLQDSEEGRAPEGGSVPSTEKHSISVEAESSLIRFIKGKRGSTKEKIEEEMGVKIIFPSSKKDESIVIEGISADSVARASERIQLIINEVP